MRNALERIGLFAISLVFAGCALGKPDARSPEDVIERASRGVLTRFASEAELRGFLRDLRAAENRARRRELASCSSPKHLASSGKSCVPKSCAALGCGVHADGCGATIDCGPCAGSPKSAAPAAAEEMEAPEAATPSAAPPADSITNVQHAGVDEGSIVKLHGNHLIVLRRGRLFTLDIGSDALAPVSTSDAFGPDIDPSGTWYDEMLVSKDSVVVIGYSYARGGTELGIFSIDDAGKLGFRATYELRSNDYYSSRNYASRLIGNRLIFYAPLSLSASDGDLFSSFPALRKWRGSNARGFHRIVRATDVYRPLSPTSELTLHSVTVCDLERPELVCRSKVVLGPAGRVFYVSPQSVYVWVSGEGYGHERTESLVYRMPLDGGEPSVLRASGSPVDQFSFLESDGHLNVLLRANANGDGMWNSEVSAGDVALMRVGLENFDAGRARAPSSSFVRLPKPDGDTFQNRFVGNYVLYGTGSGWGDPRKSAAGAVYAYGFASDGNATARLRLRHGVDRIEALGDDAIVIGTDGRNLHFSPVALGDRPWVAPGYVQKDAAQGELRSHGFFYRSDGTRKGLLGLPVRRGDSAGYEHLFRDSASVLFLENDSLRLSELGALFSKAEADVDDGCRASCVDWYGNARPIFVRNRIFALLGYEIVEGELTGGRLRERRRVSFAPPSVAR